MNKTLSGLLHKPVHIAIGHSDKSGEIRLSLWLVTVIIAALLLLAVLIGALMSSESDNSHLQQIASLQHERSQLSSKLSEAEALLLLRAGQIEGLKHELDRGRKEKQTMQKRLALFDDVLAARKKPGVHLLQPRFTWLNANEIAYRLILVKGENYPRWIKGHLAFSASDEAGNAVALTDAKGRDKIKLEMTTHAFVEGKLRWSQAGQPQTLNVSLINHLGRRKVHQQVAIDMPEETAVQQEEKP